MRLATTVRPTVTTMASIRAFLARRQAQLDAGEAAYIVHRVEVGRPRYFLDAVKLAMPQARCFYAISPWPRTAPSNVLVVQMPARCF